METHKTFTLPDGTTVTLSRNGDPDVWRVQRAIQLLGYGERLEADGINGPHTQRAIRTAQQYYGCTVDGDVKSKRLRAMLRSELLRTGKQDVFGDT